MSIYIAHRRRKTSNALSPRNGLCQLCCLACSLLRAHPKERREYGLRKGTGEGIGKALCHDIYRFITRVSLMANTHSITDGLALLCLML